MKSSIEMDSGQEALRINRIALDQVLRVTVYFGGN